MKTIEIYWDDIVPEKQQEILEITNGDNANWDVFPIASIDIEEEC